MTEPLNDTAIGNAVINAAKRWLGTTYAWGGGDRSGPTKGIRDGGVADRFGDYMKVGFDCSGLTQYAWGQVDIEVGGDSTTQHAIVPRISAPKTGCIMWWPGHVALYIDGSSMIEAPQSGDVVKISPFRGGAVYHWPNTGNAKIPTGSGDLTGNVTQQPVDHTTLGSMTGFSAKAIAVAGIALIGIILVFTTVMG